VQHHATDAAEAASAPLLDIDGARATIRLNRPRHLNRLQADDLGAFYGFGGSRVAPGT